MISRAHLFFGVLLCCFALAGCLPSDHGFAEGERESNYVEGKSRAKTLDFKGAIESFEKALEINPDFAPAHFELACLFEKRQADPAAAIYHFQKFLKFRPKAENAEIVNEHITACKQELARGVSLGPVNERQQREFEQLVNENQRLRAEVAKYQGYITQLETLTNQSRQVVGNPVPQSNPVLLAQPQIQNISAKNNVENSQQTDSSGQGSAVIRPRSHVIIPGETPISIARKYGLKVQTLMAANPRLDAKRLRPGQSLALPMP